MSKNRKISRKRFVKLYASRHPHMRAAKDAVRWCVAVRHWEEWYNREHTEKNNTQYPIWKGLWEMAEEEGCV